MNFKRIEKNWKERGFSFGVWKDPPGQTWENYVHDTDELFMVIEGRVEIQMKDKRFCPRVGEEVLIPARTTHSVRNLGEGFSGWLYGYKSA